MKNRTNKKLKLNFKLKTFLVFLSLSIVFWSLIKLSKTYVADVEFDVAYSSLSVDKTIQNKPITQVTASIESTGFNLLSYKIKNKKLNFGLQNLVHKKGNKYYYLPNHHLLDLKSQLDIETTIVRIVQDSILVVLGKNKTKKIPIKLDADIQFKLGYNFAEKIALTPQYITIIGPEEQLDTIDEIKTNKLILSEVSSEVNKKISLNISKYEGLSFSDSEVLVAIKVDKFTEGTLSVPFKIVNLPKEYSITTFPTKVNVIYQVGLLNFNKITSKNFEVICDYNESKDNGLSYLIPKIVEKTSLITSVKIVPNKIEYLIEKK